MRRSACLLALLGMTAQSAFAEQPFPAGTVRPADSQAARQFSAGNSGDAATAGAPQRFIRSPEASDPSMAAPGEELRKYYQELFGESAPDALATEPSPAATDKSADKVVHPIQEAAAEAPADQSHDSIVHAEFQEKTGAAEPIQQVRAERFSARPFPAAKPSETAVVDLREQPEEQSQSPEQPGRTSLTEPINVQPQAAPRTLSPATNAKVTATAEATAAKSSHTPAQETSPEHGGFMVRRTPSIAARTHRAPTTVESSTATVAAAPNVTLSWNKLSNINVGEKCACQLVVKNSGQETAQAVEVRAFFPETVRLVAAKPEPTHAQSFVGWTLPELKAGEQRVLEVTMVPLQRGEINTRADVRFTGSATGSFAVSEPLLEIKVEGPHKVMVGEPASQSLTISNPGTGIAEDVQVEAIIPEGLEHARGKRLLMELGNLNPGETRNVRLSLAAMAGGQHHIQIQARAGADLIRDASSKIEVIAPSLSAQIDGPGMRYLGRSGQFVVTISNDGAAANNNVQLRYKVPVGFDFVSSDRGAQFDPSTRLVTWFVGRLEPESQAKIGLTLAAREIGNFKHLVRATSEHGGLADAEFQTKVEGTSSLSLQVRDLEDPVEVGSAMTYEIRVRNEGSAPAKAVGVSCELAPGMSFENAQGPAEHLIEGQKIVFRSLPELGPGQVATFNVSVSANKIGNLRLKAHLTSESVTDPVTTEELTKFYGN